MKHTIKQLRYIEAAARCGSVAGAAKQLNISQSSVHAAIGSFEKKFGYELFKRSPSGAQITSAAGEEALEYIRIQLDRLQRLEDDLISIGRPATGLLRLGILITVAHHLGPSLVSNFFDRFPGVSFDIKEGDSFEICDRIESGQSDLGIVYADFLPEHLHFEPLIEARTFALLPASDALARQSSVSLADLAQRPMITLNLPAVREHYVNMFRAKGLVPEMSHSTMSVEVAGALVASGIGYMLQQFWRLESESAGEICMRPISDEINTATLGVVTVRGIRLPPIAREFIDHCRQMREKGGFDDLLAFPGDGRIMRRPNE